MLLPALVMTTAFAEVAKPQFTKISDIYVPTQRPTPIEFTVLAVDGIGNKVNVECDKISGQLFKVGITRVNCYAKDVFNNELRGSFFVTVGYEVVEIPAWYKNAVSSWIKKDITDKEYFNSLEYLINKKIIKIPSLKEVHDVPETKIPSWIYKTSELWANNKTGNHEYSITIKWFIENDFVKI